MSNRFGQKKMKNLAEHEEDTLTGIQNLVDSIEEMQTLRIEKKLLNFINEARTSFFWREPNCISLRLWYTYSLDIYSSGNNTFTWEDFIRSVQKQYPSPKNLVDRLFNTNTYVLEAFQNYGVVKTIDLPTTYDYEYEV